MTDAAFTSGKDHAHENFPVGSRLIAAKHRPAVMAYYRFARAADDIADAAAPAAERLARLDAMEAGLDGGAGPEVARVLGAVMAERRLDIANARDLLTAFRRDVVQDRTPDWDALIDYCRWSAMPVGRFMLNVHGEAPALRPASDALCAALQIINHLQDCRADYAALGRVYLPGDAMAAAGIGVEALGLPIAQSRSSRAKSRDARQPRRSLDFARDERSYGDGEDGICDFARDERDVEALANLVRSLARRVEPLLAEAAGFAAAIAAPGLAYEVAVIHALATGLTARLQHDPFAASRHHGRISAGLIAIRACGAMALRRFGLRTARGSHRG